MPQRKENRVKPPTDISRMRRLPKRLASHPVSGNTIALDTRYEVSTQVASSVLAERFPAICGNETLTTVVSSTSMKVPSITEMAMIHGLTAVMSERSGIYLRIG